MKRNIEFFEESRLDSIVTNAREIGGGVLFLAGVATGFVEKGLKSTKSKLVKVNGSFYREDKEGFVTLDKTPLGAAVVRFDDSEIDNPIF